MKSGIGWILALGMGLAGAFGAQAATPVFPVGIQAQGTLDSAPVGAGSRTRELSLAADDIVRRAGFDPRTHLLAVVGEADAMELVIWNRRQARNAPGTAAARIGSVAITNKLRLSPSRADRPVELATVSLALRAVAGDASMVMGSTGIARLAGDNAGTIGLVPATQDGSGSLGTIELCRASACSKGYLTTVDVRISFRRSIGFLQTAVPDSDGDGYADDVDQCPGAADEGFGIDSVGCPIPGTQDSDGDGIIDAQDACPGQGDAGFGVDSNGCPNIDSDGDGVPDSVDFCPDRGEEGYGVDTSGCPNPPAPQDFDGDGVTDDVDQCFSEGDTFGFGVDSNGCPIMDSDGDGFADPQDSCPYEGDAGNGLDSAGCPIPGGG